MQQRVYSLLLISQATTTTFTDLYIQYTLLVFVQVGSKRVLCPINGELIGQAEDVIIFPQGSMVTMENRPLLGQDYRAMGVFFFTVYALGTERLELPENPSNALVGFMIRANMLDSASITAVYHR